MSETGSLLIPNTEKTEIVKSDVIKEVKVGTLVGEDIESTTNLVRNLGATNLLEEGQKLLLPVEAQKSLEEELKKVDCHKSVETSVVAKEVDTPIATPREEDNSHKPEALPTEISAQVKEELVAPVPEESSKLAEPLEEKSDKEGESVTKGEIFSISGQKGVKMSRHRDQVTVFPSGCMGIPEDEESSQAPNRVGRRFLRASDVQERDSGHLEGVPRRRPPSASVRQANQQRNPLTGEGYIEADFICGHGKHLQPIGKHPQFESTTSDIKEKKTEKIEVTVEAPKEIKPKRIPPGGYSSPLW